VPAENTTPPRGGFWKRWDPHIQRWAGIAGIGVVVVPLLGFALHHYNRWPFEAPDEPARNQVTTAVRYQSPDWLQNVEIRGIDPVFEVRVEFDNISQMQVNDVVLKLDYPPNANPILGAATLIEGNYPNGTPVPDDLVGESGINIGNFSANSNARIRTLFRLDYSGLPCGTTPIPFKTSLRIGTSSFDDAIYSNVAIVNYNRPCS
jgi:hypothetical protein